MVLLIKVFGFSAIILYPFFIFYPKALSVLIFFQIPVQSEARVYIIMVVT